MWPDGDEEAGGDRQSRDEESEVRGRRDALDPGDHLRVPDQLPGRIADHAERQETADSAVVPFRRPCTEDRQGRAAQSRDRPVDVLPKERLPEGIERGQRHRRDRGDGCHHEEAAHVDPRTRARAHL
jgi:hypothetical protein